MTEETRTIADWRQAVACGSTLWGFLDWLQVGNTTRDAYEPAPVPPYLDEEHLSFTILPNGDLRMEANVPARMLLAESDQGWEYSPAMMRMMEEFSCNGSYTLFDPSRGNPYVGLTDVPCIAESLDLADSGQRFVRGRLWIYKDGTWCNYVEDLIECGEAIFTLVGERG